MKSENRKWPNCNYNVYDKKLKFILTVGKVNWLQVKLLEKKNFFFFNSESIALNYFQLTLLA